MLEAAADALVAQFQTGVERGNAEFQEQKQALEAEISALKEEIKVKRDMATEKLASFEKDLSAGVSQIQQAFTKLFQ